MTSKTKTWILVGCLAVVGFIGSKLAPTEKVTKPEITQAQKDSAASAKKLEAGLQEARYNLMNYVRDRLSDPKSMEVLRVESYHVGETTIVAVVEFTAKNGFGGVQRAAVQAEADLYGNLTKVFDDQLKQ